MFGEGPPISANLHETASKKTKKEKRPNRGKNKSERRKGRGGNSHNHSPRRR